MQNSIRGIVVMAAVLTAAMGVAGSATAEAPSDQACLTCHGSPGIEHERGGSVYVNPQAARASVHGTLGCVACHSGITSIPHAPRLALPRCASCHARASTALAGGAHARLGEGQAACMRCHGGAHQVKAAAAGDGEACATCHAVVAAQYAGSIHGVKQAQGDREVAVCRDCHGRAHDVIAHTDPRAPTHRDHLAETCAKCHADRALTTRRKITIPAAVALYQKSVHGRSKNPMAATCSDCHESHALRRAADPVSSIYKANIPTTCGRCHPRESRDYKLSVHGTALARGVTASPACTDCHGEHLIRGPKDLESPVAAASVTATCAHCHEALGIRETFGLPAGRLSTYQDSYHGLAARGGSPVAANCASCHGTHKILPSSDPASAVNSRNLPITCGKCHPGASDRFARGAVHVAMARPDKPLLGFVRITYLWLIALTIGGMVLHNLLDFSFKSRRRLREHLGAAAEAAGHVATHAEAVLAEGGRWFVRMTESERLQHGALALSFVTLVFTGFALKFPESWLFAWLARLEGGYAWRSLIHRGAAVLMVTAALYHLVYLASARGRRFLLDMLPKPEDAFQILGNFAYWLGLSKTPPAFDRFGYIEKAEYWALIWGTAVMTVTGLVLWFENQSLQMMDKWVLDLATLVHYYEAWLAFLAIVVWHVYQNVFNPDVYPMNWAWWTGRITEEQLRHEHRAEWDRIRAEEEAERVAEAEAEEVGLRPEASGPVPAEEPGQSPA